MIIEARELFTGETTYAPGWIRIEDEHVIAAGEGTAGSAPDLRFREALIAPGYVDVHCHGGGGGSFSTTDDDEIDQVLTTHLATGTTTMVASLVTASPDTLRSQIATLTRRFQAGDIAGIHLEGPWLSPDFMGAHDGTFLMSPEIGFLTELIELGQGAIKMVTIAPELDGGLAAIRFLADHDVVVAIGHTGCTYDQACTAIAAGARGATHLFNAMAPLHHRRPGPILALLRDPRVYLEIIFDDLHIHPDLAAFALDLAGRRGVLVTDAMAAAGNSDGRYLLGELEVSVEDSVARLEDSDTIAGSTLLLESAVQNAVAAGVPRQNAIRAATANAADYLKLPGVGRLEPGAWADLIVLDQQLNIQRTMRHGNWASAADRLAPQV